MKPRNFEESLVWWSILGVYGLYLVGGLYIWWSIVAWVLFGRLLWKLWTQNADTPAAERVRVPGSLWVWVVCMLVMELALAVGHADFDLGLAKLATSTINWGREWATLALFPLAGCLNIRPALLTRAVCVLCLESLLVIPLYYLGCALHLPERLYVSPLWYVGGNNRAMYEVFLYQPDPENQQIRLQLFAPWAPALGLVANVYLLLAWRETSALWRRIAVAGCLAMVLVSFSRLAVLALPCTLVLVWLACHWRQPLVSFFAGGAALTAGICWTVVGQWLGDVQDAFNSARASSSRVRTALGHLAVERWQSEAPLWGHGIIEPKGPKLVEFMPIGTHHTWFSLLYTKGIVGFAALAVLFAWSLAVLVARAEHSALARTALGVLLTLLVFSFGENIDILCYLCAPGLMVIGMAFKERPVRLEALRPLPATAH